MTKHTKKTSQPITRTVFEDATSRIDRISDRYYFEYVVYIGGAYFSSGYSTQVEAESARDAAVYELLSKKAA